MTSATKKDVDLADYLTEEELKRLEAVFKTVRPSELMYNVQRGEATLSPEVLGICDYPQCDEVAYWECGEVYDRRLGKNRMARWCDKHCPK